MPDSTGFGDYTESGQVIPVKFAGARWVCPRMYLDDQPRSRAGATVGFPKKLAAPKLTVEKDTLLGVLRFGPVPVAVATMGFKHRALDHDKILASLDPNYLLKIIVDGSARICELVRYFAKISPSRSVGGTGSNRAISPCTGAGCRLAGAKSFRSSHPLRSHTRAQGPLFRLSAT
jgi:acetoacetate decarboxylase